MRVVAALCLGLLTALVVDGTAEASTRLQSSTDSTPNYRKAYDRWCRAIDANPRLSWSWLDTDSGPADLRTAVQDLISIGPNMIDFIAQEMRSEQDPMRLYRLVLLLNRVSGINMHWRSGEDNHFSAMPRFRDQFLEAWDSGKLLNASEHLKDSWKWEDEAASTMTVDLESLVPFTRFGVFAIPFKIQKLQQHNSAVLFAAFLNIIGEYDLYSTYIEKPYNLFPSRMDKLTYVRTWATRNAGKMDRLVGLNTQIQMEAK